MASAQKMGALLMKTNSNTTLLERLAAADREWQKVKGRAFWWRSIPVILAIIVAAFGADAFFQMSASSRIAWIAAGAVIALVLAILGWGRGWITRNPPERTARFLETRDPELGSRLINALQLSKQITDAGLHPSTRSFARMAVERYNTEIAPLNLPGLTRTGQDREALRWMAWALASFAALLAAFYPVVGILLPRFLDPLGDHPPYSFTQLEILSPNESGADVVYGAPLMVKVEWSGHDPRELFLTVHPEGKPDQSVTLPMIRESDHGYFQEIADVRSDLVITAHGKNRKYFSKQRQARVILTPKIDRAFLEIISPEYTGIPAKEQPFSFKATSALEGSKLRFRLHSNRPLREGKLEAMAEGKESAVIPLELSGTHEVRGELTMTETLRARFGVTDVDGLVSTECPETMITVMHDIAPVVSITEPAQDGFVSVGYALTAKFEATDDYGVRTLRVHQALNGAFSEPRIFQVEGVKREVVETVPVNFQELGAKPGDTISFFAEAIDTAPSPHLSRSKTVTLTLISEQEYNDFLREQMDVRSLSKKYEDLMERFYQLRDRQSKLAEEATRLEERNVDPSKKTGAFDAIVAKQNEIDQQLNKMADEMEHFVRDEPVYDFEKSLQQSLKEDAGEVKNSTAFNDKVMKELAQESTAGDGSRSLSEQTLHRLRKEAQLHAERLGARQKSMVDSIKKPLEDLSALHDMMNDFTAFEQMYQEQKELAQQAAAYGKKQSPSREDQLALKELGARQEAVREALSQLPEMLRQHAAAGEKKFPKAAKSCNNLADAIEHTRLAPEASAAVERLLEADGENGALLTARLEKEMAALMSQCKSQGPGEGELDQYLGAHLPGSGAGNSFEQMKKCRMAGFQSGRAVGQGKGQGTGGGYSTSSSDMDVLGNEQFSPQGDKHSSRSSKNGHQATGNPGSAERAPQADSPDVLKNLNPEHRQSGAVQGESSIEQYRAVVDEYFKKVTRP